MRRRGYENLVTGVTAKLRSDYARLTDQDIQHAAQFRPGSVEVVSDRSSEMLIRLPGAPMGKPRMTRRDKWAKRDCVVRYREWADRLRAAAGKVPPAERVVELSWKATFEPPQSWSKKRRVASIGQLHRSKPDRDNVDKAILDALYPKGDSGIARGTIEKRWGWEDGLEIKIVFERHEPKNERAGR